MKIKYALTPFTKCKECDEVISKKAKVCPKCGAPQKEKKPLFIWLVIIVLVFCVIGYFSDDSNTRSRGSANYSDPDDFSAHYSLVKGSDDFSIYKRAFAKAAYRLIASPRCSASDFIEMGGWIKSLNHRNQPIYFTYCGGMRSSNKIYLNAATGELKNN